MVIPQTEEVTMQPCDAHVINRPPRYTHAHTHTAHTYFSVYIFRSASSYSAAIDRPTPFWYLLCWRTLPPRACAQHSVHGCLFERLLSPPYWVRSHDRGSLKAASCSCWKLPINKCARRCQRPNLPPLHADHRGGTRR